MASLTKSETNVHKKKAKCYKENAVAVGSNPRKSQGGGGGVVLDQLLV